LRWFFFFFFSLKENRPFKLFLQRFPYFLFFKKSSSYFNSWSLKTQKIIDKNFEKFEKTFREVIGNTSEKTRLKYLKIKASFKQKRQKNLLIFKISNRSTYNKILKALTVLFSMGLKCFLVQGGSVFFLKIYLNIHFSRKKIDLLKKFLVDL